MTDRDKTAFILGFLSSKEGFNAECTIRSLAPDSIKLHIKNEHDSDVAEAVARYSKCEPLMKLFEEAKKILDNG